MSHLRGCSNALLTVLTGGAVIAALYIAASRVAADVMAGANLALVGLAVMASFEAVMSLPAAFQYLGQTREAGRRLFEVVDAPPPVIFPLNSARIPRQLDLELEDVCFRYGDSDPPVLKSVSLRIPYGRRVALLGQTGEGKSTLAHLLTRFMDPSSGRILIGGVDIRTFAERDLRHMVCVISQRAYIFSATVRDNLLFARPDAGEEALREALRGVQLLDFVDSLPEGIDTWVGEAGKLLSGGQSRRLAVARAILRDAPLWILDEPTEGLDRGTERFLLEAILKQAGERTVMLITHRPAMLEKMDRIVVLEGGQVVFCGTQASLAAENPRYAELYRDMG
jgi:ATP-binding cassette subfamily C protein CydC